MSRLVPKVPPPPPFGAGFVKNASTGLYDVDGIMPQLLSGPLLATDLAIVLRGTGPAGTPNLTSYSAPMSAVLTGGATPAPTPTPTTTPAPTPASSTIPADGTLSGLPSTIVAGQPLSVASVTSQTSLYFVLYRVSAGVEEGSRWIGNVMPGGTLSLLVPQSSGAYTVRGFAAATGGTATYESGQISVTSAPGALPATPTQTADTGVTATGVTMNWTSTASSYLVLARPGTGTAYGTLANTTITTNSYTFAHLSANSSPRAIIIAQNPNGYGTAGLCLSSVAATAIANETLTLASPGPQTSGSSFTLSGTYSGITPTAFDMQRVGAVSWGAVDPRLVTIGNGTFTIVGVAATYPNPSTRYAVRDQSNPANTATTPAFAVS
jgi:hypothetical protein